MSLKSRALQLWLLFAEVNSVEERRRCLVSLIISSQLAPGTASVCAVFILCFAQVPYPVNVLWWKVVSGCSLMACAFVTFP